MELMELLEEIAGGEQSTRQFKVDVTTPVKLAQEFVAFSNSQGGRMFIGVGDDGVIVGLAEEDVRRINQMVSNVASQGVIPAINPTTENVVTDRGVVMVITIPRGLNCPYQDKDGAFWVKSGSDKRKATSREELQRMFQAASLVHADEVAVLGTSSADIDIPYFNDFFSRRYGGQLERPLEQVLKNLNLSNGENLNLAGQLLFAKDPSARCPMFIVKAGSFSGTDLTSERYEASVDISGRLADVFAQTVGFILGNLHHGQGGQGVNSIGAPEIPRSVLEELVANALIHRDYFISAPVRVFVFADRIEIISPGHLPNNLTIDNIKAGNTNARNPVLTSFANHLIPYRGYGGGIMRAYAAYPSIDLIDDRDGNLFKVIIYRFSHRFGNNNISNLFYMKDLADKFSQRMKNAFGDLAAGTEIADGHEIMRRMSMMFGEFPCAAPNDVIWWTRGMKAMPIGNVRYDSSLMAFYLDRLECRIDRIVPYYNSTFPERSFVYVGMAPLSADGREEYVKSDSDYWTSWRVIPMSYYKGELISEESAEEGYMEDADGDCVDLDSSDLVRFTRFVTPQNILITCKPNPSVRDEVTYGQAVWSAMDEILSGEGTPFKIRDILWRE